MFKLTIEVDNDHVILSHLGKLGEPCIVFTLLDSVWTFRPGGISSARSQPYAPHRNTMQLVQDALKAASHANEYASLAPSPLTDPSRTQVIYKATRYDGGHRWKLVYTVAGTTAWYKGPEQTNWTICAHPASEVAEWATSGQLVQVDS